MYEELNKNLQQFRIFHKDHSIDESMVPSYGHHSYEMFIHRQPIRFGYKVWILCSNNGYPYNMEIYGRKSESHNEPLGSMVVNNLLSSCGKYFRNRAIFKNYEKKVNIPEPNLIRKYNLGVGGVDVLDRLLGSYRPQLRSKKWRWNLFSNSLHMAVVASYLLYQEVHNDKQTSQLNFRRTVPKRLLHLWPTTTSRPGPRAREHSSLQKASWGGRRIRHDGVFCRYSLSVENLHAIFHRGGRRQGGRREGSLVVGLAPAPVVRSIGNRVGIAI
ncbi:hypothetical protein PR048_018698 [Dryococelus australis]|uniref:PiggyBac transposable element-derived protein domain-containing protein n=1 Tax=Dryococelus australis TaxID=614101 RepID=A0ABQ9HCY4_9NEOP|nr:hypothetical protein PR048_018698 [Dryococelus australis]